MADLIDELLLSPQTGSGRTLADESNQQLLAALERAPALAQEVANGPMDERVDAQLVHQSVAGILVDALRHRRDHVFSRGLLSLQQMWEAGDPITLRALIPADSEASLWESLALEIHAVGAFAVDRRLWDRARDIVAHVSPSSGEGWLRQGQVTSARAAAGDADAFPGMVIRSVERLAPDLRGDAAKRAFAVFDLFSALVIVELDLRYGYYPSGAVFDSDVVESFVIDELRDEQSEPRQHVFASDRDGLRSALRVYDEQALVAAAYQRYAGADWRWRAFADARTWSFINEGYRLEELRI